MSNLATLRDVDIDRSIAARADGRSPQRFGGAATGEGASHSGASL